MPQVSKEDVPITETQGSILSSTAHVHKPAQPRSALLESLSITGPSTMSIGPTMVMASTPVEGHAYGVFIEPLDPYLMAILLYVAVSASYVTLSCDCGKISVV